MNIDQQQFISALSVHHPVIRPAKRKAKAKDIRAANKDRPTKVKKATKLNVCTLGGTLSNRHNDSGRARISSRDLAECLSWEVE